MIESRTVYFALPVGLSWLVYQKPTRKLVARCGSAAELDLYLESLDKAWEALNQAEIPGRTV